MYSLDPPVCRAGSSCARWEMGVTAPVIEPDVLDDQRARFNDLERSAHFEQVVAANRLYLMAAVPDPLDTERAYWALSCLPRTHGGNRFSTLSMSTMETFVLHQPRSSGAGITGFVVVSRKALESGGRALHADGLEVRPSDYVAAGDDQCSVWGGLPALVRALAGTLGEPAPLRCAAREMATRLTGGRGTNY